MAEPASPAPTPSTLPQTSPSAAPPKQQAQQLQLAGMPPPAMPLQGRFVAAAQYASLQLQVCAHLFPGRTLFQLSHDERRILANETNFLVLQARWQIEAKVFAEQFAQQPPGLEMAPAGTVLGEQPGMPTAAAATGTGGYL